MVGGEHSDRLVACIEEPGLTAVGSASSLAMGILLVVTAIETV